METHKRRKAIELYELGSAVAIAFSEPKRLKEFLPVKPFDPMSIPAMLRIPKHGR